MHTHTRTHTRTKSRKNNTYSFSSCTHLLKTFTEQNGVKLAAHRRHIQRTRAALQKYTSVGMHYDTARYAGWFTKGRSRKNRTPSVYKSKRSAETNGTYCYCGREQSPRAVSEPNTHKTNTPTVTAPSVDTHRTQTRGFTEDSRHIKQLIWQIKTNLFSF